MSSNLFSPAVAGTVTITSAVTTARVVINMKNQNQLCVINSDTSNIAYVSWGDVTVTATVPSGATGGSIPILPATTRGFSVPPGITNVAAVCSAGTPLVLFTPGEGL